MRTKIGQCKNNGNGRHKKTRPPRKVPGGLLYVRTKNPLTMAKIKKKIIKFIFLIKLLNLTLIKIRKWQDYPIQILLPVKPAH